MCWHRIVACSAVAIALGCTLPTSRLGGSLATDAAVRAAELRRFAAMSARDLPALDTLLADDLTYTHTTGRVDSKASLLDDLRAGRLVYDSIVPDDVRVRVYGRAAAATGRARMQVRAGDQRLRFAIRFTELYVERGGRWQLVVWQSTRLPEP